MPRTRACPACGQMCLLGGFEHHVQQCSKKMARIEMPCPYCEKMYPQLDLSAHMAMCPRNQNMAPKGRAAAARGSRGPANGRRAVGGSASSSRRADQTAGAQSAEAAWHAAADERIDRRRALDPGTDSTRYDTMSVKELRAHIAAAGMSASDCIEKSDLRARAREAGRARTRRGNPARDGATAQPGSQASQQRPQEFGGGAGLAPCGQCGRTFSVDRIGKHMSICGRQKQRRIFDSATQRAPEGQERFSPAVAQQARGGHAPGRRGASGVGGRAEVKPPSRWREEHRQFQNAMRAAHGKPPLRSEYHGGSGVGGRAYGGGGGGSGGGGGGGGGLGRGGSAYASEHESSSGPSSFIPCPHCGRTFAPAAASRHIPSCKVTAARPKPPPALRGAAARAAPRAAGWNMGTGGGKGRRGR